MKKIVGIIAAAALAATAFAEVNIGTWNRAVFEPFYYDGDTLRSYEGPSWDLSSNGGVRTGLGFSASSENAGMVIQQEVIRILWIIIAFIQLKIERFVIGLRQIKFVPITV